MSKFKWYKWTEENVNLLKENAKKSTSFRTLLLKMGFKEGNAGYRRLHIAIKKFNVDISHFERLNNKGKNFITKPSLSKKSFDEHFSKNSTTGRSIIKKVIIQENLINYECKSCGIKNIWNSKPINLHLDHINGINNDNRLENLRFLCPNCHSQTETYCANTQIRYTDEEIKSASIGCSSIRQVMLKMNMTTGTNYKRLKKLLPHLIRNKKDIVEKENEDLIKSIVSKKISKLPRPTTRKVNRPSKEELQKMVEEKPILTIGKEFGVSDNAVRKWCKSYGIEMKPLGFWTKVKYNKI